MQFFDESGSERPLAITNANQASAIDVSLPLHYAVDRNHVEVVKLLLSYSKTNVNATTNKGITAIYMAVHPRINDWSQVRMWIEENRVPILKLLLEQEDIDPNVQVPITGTTALMAATSIGNVDAVRLLLNHPKIDTQIKNNKSLTALEHAQNYAGEKREELVKLIHDKRLSDLGGPSEPKVSTLHESERDIRMLPPANLTPAEKEERELIRKENKNRRARERRAAKKKQEEQARMEEAAGILGGMGGD